MAQPHGQGADLEGGQEQDDNFLSRFKGGDAADAGAGADQGEEDGDEDVESDDEEDLAFKPPPRTVAGMQVLPASWEVPICQECGNEEGPDGGGRYGFDDHDGLFFCGTCWTGWDPNYKAKIMKPAYQQRSDGGTQREGKQRACPSCGDVLATPSQRFCGNCGVKQPEASEAPEGEQDGKEANFFSQYETAEGTDEVEGAWDPSNKEGLREGEQALPGSWDRPLCTQCGNDEGDHGGGRYGHGPDCEKFFCGRCWQSWDVADRNRMMRAYDPSDRGGRHPMDPGVFCPPPPMPHFGDPGHGFEEEEEEEEEWDEEEEWVGEAAWNEEDEEEGEEGDEADGADQETACAAEAAGLISSEGSPKHPTESATEQTSAQLPQSSASAEEIEDAD